MSAPEKKTPPKRRLRLGSRDVETTGLPPDGLDDVYHSLLTISTPLFLGVMALGYLAINAVFAGIYMLDRPGIANAGRDGFWDFFFFSVQTLGTLGYGPMYPKSPFANGVVAAEVFVGLMNFGLATGLLFARVSRPTARIMFSRCAVVTPMDNVPTLMLRAANRRRNLVLEAEVSITLVHDARTAEGDTLRRFVELPPVRGRSPLFSLTWQVMHQIGPDSPLAGETRESLAAKNAEILVVIRGTDESFVHTIQARASYLPREIVWGRRLADILAVAEDGRRTIDFSRFDDLE